MSEVFEGRCSCRALTYQMTTRPMITHCCHCRYCQRETGSAFAVNAIIEADRVVVTSGETVEATIPSESGKGLILVRCAACLVPVWSHYVQDRFTCWVRVGTLLESDRIKPDVHIFTASKQTWVTIPEDLPSFEAFYDWENNTFWTEASKARDQALIAKIKAAQS